MIAFQKYTLDNGLTIILHQDKKTPLAAVNLLYKVGAKNESADRTGFAHFFEHLMFGGSSNAPSFDESIQTAGGENNAFTNSDITNFYELLPVENLKTALFLEADRMMNLMLSKKSIDTQRKVVIEEFKEVCLNTPYGDSWHHISNLAYEVHPYQWPTIGKIPDHIAEAPTDQIHAFYNKYYVPNNAILVIAGNINFEEVKNDVQQYFGDIPRGKTIAINYQQEPIQQSFRDTSVKAKVPLDSVYLAFHMSNRMNAEYYTADLISDILSIGRSSRFFQHLYKKELFTNIDAYISGTEDPGLFIIEGKPGPGISLDKAESLIWQELDKLQNKLVSENELNKVKNKVETSILFSETSILNKAMNLAYFEALGDASISNREVEQYKNVSAQQILAMSKQLFNKNNCSRVIYHAIS